MVIWQRNEVFVEASGSITTTRKLPLLQQVVQDLQEGHKDASQMYIKHMSK